jgi:DNA invertase Pin-like site-specific DNA recombinase
MYIHQRKESASVSEGAARRAVLYARVSTKEQEAGYSIAAQQELLRCYAVERGLQVEQEFVEVATAKQAGRPGFTAMVAHFRKQPGCRVLLVEKSDRLSRNHADAARIEELDIEVHLVKENLVMSRNSRAADKFFYDMNMIRAKNYIDNLSEEARKGLRTKASQGLWPSYAPLGYRNTAGADQKRVITPDPVLGPIVTSLFEWFATGEYSLKALAQRAYEEGCRFRKSQGKVPTSTLHKMLRNPIYKGEIEYAGERHHGVHEPLVSREVWDRVQEILSDRGKKKHRKVTHDFVFSGMVRCGHCGCSMVGEKKKGKYVYYHCTGYRGKCGEPYTPERILDQEFASSLEELVMPPAVVRWLEAELAESDQAEATAVDQLVRRHQTELARSQSRLDLLYDDRLDGRIDPTTYDRKAQEIREQRQQIQKRIAEAQQRPDPSASQTVDLATGISQTSNLFQSQSAAERRKLLRLVVQDASWRRGALQMSFRAPFEAFSNREATG